MLLGLTGRNGAGKGVVADYLKSKGFLYYSLSDILRKEVMSRGLELTRDHLFDLGNELRLRRGAGVLAQMTAEIVDQGKNCVIDSIRHPEEVKTLRKLEGFKLMGVDAPAEIRFERMRERAREKDPQTLEEFLALEEKEARSATTEHQQLHQVVEMSDHIVMNSSTLEVLYDHVERALQAVAKKG